MLSRPVFAPFGSRSRAILALVPLLLSFQPVSAHASFHLNEITKVMVGLNGNTTVQAVELKMLATGQNLVATYGVSMKAYDANGVLLATLGAFTSNLSQSAAGSRILCATSNFASIFGITPDLIITPDLPVTTGQVSFETPTCLVNAVAYGAVAAPKNGSTSAQALFADGATALVRITDDPSGYLAPSCPLSEDAAARFQLVSGTSTSPITFTNNSGATVSVFAQTTAVSLVTLGATAELGRVHLAWYVPESPGDNGTVYRRATNSAWASLGHVQVAEDHRVVYEDTTVVSGETYGYRLIVGEAASADSSNVVWVSVPIGRVAPHDPVLAPGRPNPSSSPIHFEYGVPGAGRVRFVVYDVHGRFVAIVEDRLRGPGWYSASWDGRDRTGREVASGLYFARLELARTTQVQKIVVVR